MFSFSEPTYCRGDPMFGRVNETWVLSNIKKSCTISQCDNYSNRSSQTENIE